MPKDTKQFSIYLPKELNKKLEQLAIRNVRSKNEQVVFILKEALKNYDAFLECVNEQGEFDRLLFVVIQFLKTVDKNTLQIKSKASLQILIDAVKSYENSTTGN